MILTPEQQAIGRRNFLKALAGTPALATLAASDANGQSPGRPVRLGFVGVGGQGRALLRAAVAGAVATGSAEIRALADINPAQLKLAKDALAHLPVVVPRVYADYRDMLEHEDIEGVVMAPPLWMHADIAVACMEAGKHVLCEKMMAWDVAGGERMRKAAARHNRVLEIGYQRNYNPLYEATFAGVFRKELLGDIFLTRIAWHRNGNWRRHGEPPAPDYDPSRWGYPSFEHLINWRLYHRYSRGLFAELASHQVNIVNQVYGGAPQSVVSSGGVYRFADGRQAYDHVYGTFEYAGGRTAVFSSIESNAFDDYYEMYMGTRGTLILRREVEAMLFTEGQTDLVTGLEIVPRGDGAVLDASETQPGAAPAVRTCTPVRPSAEGALADRAESTRRMIWRFCQAIREGTPLACGADKAFDSARACIRANEAVETRTRLNV